MINERGIELIKHFEGERLTAYIDPVGILTIGYGHTGSDVKPDMTITKDEAHRLLLSDIEEFAKGVRKRLKVSISGNAFAALVAFSFNVGLGAFNSSTLRKKLNLGDVKGASKEFTKWVKGTINGKKVTLPGLVRRRKAERKLFDTPDDDDSTIVATTPNETPAEDTFFHIVRPGDNFSELAAKNGLSIEALLNSNPHISDPNFLFPGDMIRFVGAAPVVEDKISEKDATTIDDTELAASPWYLIARKEIGVSEIKGRLHNNTRILDYHRSTNLGNKLASSDETPWCSSFVNWCVEKSGLEGTNSAMARSWLKWGKKLDKPREGCIVVFARPKAGPKAGHVGFFIKETAKRIRVLGGNQSNQVKESSYSKDDLLGYRWSKSNTERPVVEPATEPEKTVPKQEDADEVFYLVQPGDTLAAIAKKAGTTLEQIKAWNPQISNPNLIYPGDSVLLVDNDGPDAPPADKMEFDLNGNVPWYEQARRELNTKELPGSTRNNPRILEYHASTTLPGNLARIDETPWCSSFVNWCISRVGLKGTNSARARSWEKWGKKLNQPREGCLVVLSRPKAGPKAGHVGFFVSQSAKHIKVLGGNQSNRVKESNYPKSRLIGYRWPANLPDGFTNNTGKFRVRPPFLERLRLLRKRILRWRLSNRQPE